MRSEKGSITLFVLIAMIFFLGIAMTAYLSASSKLQGQDSELVQIQASYGQELSEDKLANLYKELTLAENVLKTDENATTPEKKSPYVRYDGNLYRVLYDKKSPYGVELISNSTVGELVTLGMNDPAGNGIAEAGALGSTERAIWSYTNAIDTLNKAAEARVNTSDGVVSDVRCVGSRPDNKNFKITDKYSNTLTPNTNPYFSQYNGLWEQGEGINNAGSWVLEFDKGNHKLDYKQMSGLNIMVSDKTYWIATRNIYVRSTYTAFSALAVNTTGRSVSGNVFRVMAVNRNIQNYVTECAMRLVIKLDTKAKITGGNGTESEPYTLGI